MKIAKYLKWLKLFGKYIVPPLCVMFKNSLLLNENLSIHQWLAVIIDTIFFSSYGFIQTNITLTMIIIVIILCEYYKILQDNFHKKLIQLYNLSESNKFRQKLRVVCKQLGKIRLVIYKHNVFLSKFLFIFRIFDGLAMSFIAVYFVKSSRSMMHDICMTIAFVNFAKNFLTVFLESASVTERWNRSYNLIHRILANKSCGKNGFKVKKRFRMKKEFELKEQFKMKKQDWLWVIYFSLNIQFNFIDLEGEVWKVI